MWAVFNAEQGSELRALIRLVTVGFTAFGLKLDVAQIALVQGALETTLALFVKSPLGSSIPSPESVVTPERLTPTAPTDTLLTSAPFTSDIVPVSFPPPVDNGVGYIAPISGDV